MCVAKANESTWLESVASRSLHLCSADFGWLPHCPPAPPCYSEYLQRPPFRLPEFIEATGIAKIRQVHGSNSLMVFVNPL